MHEWNFVEYGSLAAPDKSAFAMGPFGSKLTQRDYQESGVPLTRGINLTSGIFHDDDFVYISPEKADEVSAANVQPGDLVFTHRGTIGQVSMIPRKPRFGRYVICSSQVKTRLDESRALPEFYYYWFKSPAGQRSILANSSTVGVPGIATPLTSIRKLQVPLPDTQSQKAIAQILGSLDDKIAANHRVAELQEELLRLMFMEHGVDAEPGTNAIPTSEVIEFNPRLRATSHDDAVYVEMAALPIATARVTNWVRRPAKSGARFMNGDTLMARITPCLENGKTAFVDFLADGEVGTGSTEFIVMRSRPPYPSTFSYFLARSSRFREHAIRNMVGSSGRQRVSAQSLEKFSLRRPDMRAIETFGRYADSALTHLKSLDNESRVLAELRDTLLPKLMSGQIRIRDAERVVEEAT